MIPADVEVSVRYQGEEQIVTEKEKLEIMKMRKELGLVTHLDLIMADNPNMTRDEALVKLEEIKKTVGMIADEMTKTAVGYIDKSDNESENGDDETENEENGNGEEIAEAANAPTDGVQRLALNGAQVTSLVEIVVGVQRGEIPKDSARSMIASAFPFLDADSIERIVRPTVEGSLSESGSD